MRALAAGLLLLASCSDDPLTRLTGALEVTAVNAAPRAERVTVQAHQGDTEASGSEAVAHPGTVVLLERLNPGAWSVRVDARDRDGVPLQAVWVDDVGIQAQLVTELLVDLADSPIPPPAEICNGVDDDGDGAIDEVEDLALCAACEGGREVLLTDDERCGEVACDELDRLEVRGDNSATGDSSCVAITHRAASRCAEIGRCDTTTGACRPSESVLASAGLCRTISESSCLGGAPAIDVVPDGTPCSAEHTCQAGECVPIVPIDPEVGCADGEREGFLSLLDYPGIAGCSGGWALPGVTNSLAPACHRGAGDDSGNVAGLGCSAVDLCAEGWHVCDGKDEVLLQSPEGCAAAVPAGTPDKSLFFAVRQSSLEGSTCTDDGTGDNDVFGCGNLGNLLGADKNCAPLDRVLASTQPNSCGFNEAEPPLGPWQCLGTNDSHLHEGALVTKDACANNDCSYDGHPIASSDKGGVLCCR